MAVATANALLKKLSEPFPVKDVKQRTQGGRKLDYISIDATIRRLNDVLGPTWSTTNLNVDLREGQAGYTAIVSLNLHALEKTAVGVGADFSKTDADKAVKTALAEALKKAGHQFGIGLYLWDEDERAVVANQRAAIDGDVQTLKVQVYERAVNEGAEPTPGGIAKHFDISIDELQDVEKLKKILGL